MTCFVCKKGLREREKRNEKTKGSLGEVERWYGGCFAWDGPPFSAGQCYTLVVFTELGYESLKAEEARIKGKNR
jgi:hypothetical protein